MRMTIAGIRSQLRPSQSKRVHPTYILPASYLLANKLSVEEQTHAVTFHVELVPSDAFLVLRALRQIQRYAIAVSGIA
eukprot:3941930-Rhodomonas_salina.8